MIEITSAGISLFLEGITKNPLHLRPLDRDGISTGPDVEIDPSLWSIEGRQIICSGVVVEAERDGICTSYQVLQGQDAIFVGYLSEEYEHGIGDMLVFRIEIKLP